MNAEVAILIIIFSHINILFSVGISFMLSHLRNKIWHDSKREANIYLRKVFYMLIANILFTLLVTGYAFIYIKVISS